jgi:hypothetical protein
MNVNTKEISTGWLVLAAALAVGIGALLFIPGIGLGGLGAAPYLLLLLCSLMHLLLHGGHDHHTTGEDDR